MDRRSLFTTARSTAFVALLLSSAATITLAQSTSPDSQPKAEAVEDWADYDSSETPKSSEPQAAAKPADDEDWSNYDSGGTDTPTATTPEPAATTAQATAGSSAEPAAPKAAETQVATLTPATGTIGTDSQGKPIPVPTDPVERAAFDVLEKHCARCHQDGVLTKRVKPAKNVGNLLRLDQIAVDPTLVQPGNPDGSRIVQQMVKGEMPYDLFNEFDTSVPDVEDKDVDALRAWISQLGDQQSAACGERDFVNNNDMIAAMARDLENEEPTRVAGTRYLTITHLFNSCSSDEELNVYLTGAVKLLNSLSRSSDVVKLQTIDGSKTIVKFNIKDLGWSEKDWDAVLANYPYAVKPDTRLFDFVETATLTRLPYVRADWFAFSASQAPLYDHLLQLPKTFGELQKQLGVDVEANIRDFVAQRAGFQNSGVSMNNRLIERHTADTGYFWTSYDFAGNEGKQSLFLHPLGPTGDKGFKHDGGETLWRLPNGFQAYYLNAADGSQLQKGPIAIVRDMTKRDMSVTNALSCFGCHDQGIRKNQDEVRDQIINDRSFDKPTREAVEALYPPAEKMAEILESDLKSFQDAMRRAGLDPLLKLNGVEPITALHDRFEKRVDMRFAAAEYGLEEKTFADALLVARDNRAPGLKRRLEQNLVPRDQYEKIFIDLVDQITDDGVIDVSDLKKEFGNDNAAKAKERPVEESRDFDLSLTSDRDKYKVGDKPIFTVKTAKDCFLTMINVDGKGEATVIFPNKFQKENQITKDKELKFPGDKAPFQFKLADKGKEKVIAVCSLDKKTDDGIKHNFRDVAFTGLGNFEKFIGNSIKRNNRKIVVEAADKKKESSVQTETSTSVSPNADDKKKSKKDIVAHVAIKVDVE